MDQRSIRRHVRHAAEWQASLAREHKFHLFTLICWQQQESQRLRELAASPSYDMGSMFGQLAS